MMNKAAIMKKKMLKSLALAALAVALGVAALVATGSLKTSASERKTAAEAARNGEQSQVTNMRTQIEQSGAAEKLYVDIALNHKSEDYSANSEALKEWLRTIKDQYRFSNSLKLNLALEKPADKPEFATLSFKVVTREPMKIELAAISDTHIYSFLKQMQAETSGFIRINRLTVNRRGDLDAAAYRQLLAGLNPEFVTATIEFTWVGITPKDAPATATPANAGGA